jgi:hypothetical protein
MMQAIVETFVTPSQRLWLFISLVLAGCFFWVLLTFFLTGSMIDGGGLLADFVDRTSMIAYFLLLPLLAVQIPLAAWIAIRDKRILETEGAEPGCIVVGCTVAELILVGGFLFVGLLSMRHG